MKKNERLISDNDIANYVVCPQAWRIKASSGSSDRLETSRGKQSKQIRQEWFKANELTSSLKHYGKTIYLLLVFLVVVIFLWHDTGISLFRWQIAQKETSLGVPTEIVLIMLLVGAIIVVWDMVDRHTQRLQKSSGIAKGNKVVASRGGAAPEAAVLRSEQLRLQSKPDALMQEDNFLIPVDRLPLSKKIRDRHVAKLITHLRIIEETQARPSPYGLLIVGQDARSSRVLYTPEKKLWLDELVRQMRAITEGEMEAVASPSKFKCKNCDVHSLCKFRADQ